MIAPGSFPSSAAPAGGRPTPPAASGAAGLPPASGFGDHFRQLLGRWEPPPEGEPQATAVTGRRAPLGEGADPRDPAQAGTESPDIASLAAVGPWPALASPPQVPRALPDAEDASGPADTAASREGHSERVRDGDREGAQALDSTPPRWSAGPVRPRLSVRSGTSEAPAPPRSDAGSRWSDPAATPPADSRGEAVATPPAGGLEPSGLAEDRPRAAEPSQAPAFESRPRVARNPVSAPEVEWPASGRPDTSVPDSEGRARRQSIAAGLAAPAQPSERHARADQLLSGLAHRGPDRPSDANVDFTRVDPQPVFSRSRTAPAAAMHDMPASAAAPAPAEAVSWPPAGDATTGEARAPLERQPLVAITAREPHGVATATPGPAPSVASDASALDAPGTRATRPASTVDPAAAPQPSTRSAEIGAGTPRAVPSPVAGSGHVDALPPAWAPSYDVPPGERRETGTLSPRPAPLPVEARPLQVEPGAQRGSESRPAGDQSPPRFWTAPLPAPRAAGAGDLPDRVSEALTDVEGEVDAAVPVGPRVAEAGRPAFPSLALVTPVIHSHDGPARTEGVGPTPPPPPPADAGLPDQIVQSLRLHMTSGGGEARVHLRPEYLGELTVRVVVDNGVVTARLEAEVPAVREWIERHEVSLRQALGEHGLTLDALIVSDTAEGEEAAARDPRQPRDEEADEPRARPRRLRRDDEEAPRFEVVV